MQNKSVLGACVLGVGGDEIINGFTNLKCKKSLIPFLEMQFIFIQR
jgi:hypothetical protein